MLLPSLQSLSYFIQLNDTIPIDEMLTEVQQARNSCIISLIIPSTINSSNSTNSSHSGSSFATSNETNSNSNSLNFSYSLQKESESSLRLTLFTDECVGPHLKLTFYLHLSPHFYFENFLVPTNQEDSITLPQICYSPPLSPTQQELVQTGGTIYTSSSNLVDNIIVFFSSTNLNFISSTNIFSMLKFFKIDYSDFINEFYQSELKGGFKN